MDEDDGILLGTVTITKVMTGDDIVVRLTSDDGDGDNLAVIDVIGMIELGKDTLLHQFCCSPDED